VIACKLLVNLRNLYGIDEITAMDNKDMRVFLESYPVFTIAELREFFSLSHGNREASDMIRYNKKMGRIGRIKDGLYFSVRPGQSVQHTSVDPYLVASKLAPDAVLAYHTALDLFGFGHSIFNTYYYFSNRFHPALRFQNGHFRAVVTPEKLQKKSKVNFGTEKVERLGMKFLITGKERTLVESLERPQYCGGFEEMYRSLEKIPYLQADVILQYLELRQQKNLYARVGFFLEQHRNDFNVEESFLERLAQDIPKQPVYWVSERKGGTLVKRWNLIVPETVKHRKWEEF
jgi:predicted transcriptional regulator of viral defense system